MEVTQEQQDIGGQVCQGAIPQVILAPAARNFPLVGGDALRIPRSLGMLLFLRERVACLLKPRFLGLQFVNLAAGARLAPIETARIEKERTPDLLFMGVNGRRRQQGMHAPIRTYHALNGFPSHRLRPWDSDRQIKDGAPLAVACRTSRRVRASSSPSRKRACTNWGNGMHVSPARPPSALSSGEAKAKVHHACPLVVQVIHIKA
ncbi:MAG TPA: hypothetical protein VGP82_03750 [Ktedonobacterales bacterium]|jgi:hypothetical protein|nr:hypothetical protein [Ktedonobacterales bacterium]